MCECKVNEIRLLSYDRMWDEATFIRECDQEEKVKRPLTNQISDMVGIFGNGISTKTTAYQLHIITQFNCIPIEEGVEGQERLSPKKIEQYLNSQGNNYDTLEDKIIRFLSYQAYSLPWDGWCVSASGRCVYRFACKQLQQLVFNALIIFFCHHSIFKPKPNHTFDSLNYAKKCVRKSKLDTKMKNYNLCNKNSTACMCGIPILFQT